MAVEQVDKTLVDRKIGEEKANQGFEGVSVGLRSALTLITPYYFVRKREVLLDFNDINDIQRGADKMAEGDVVITTMCGVMGFVIDGTQENAIDKVLQLKGRTRANPLVIAGSAGVRKLLIDEDRVPLVFKFSDDSRYDLPHFLECPVKENLVPDGIGMRNDRLGRVGAIFWANYYFPLRMLEMALLARNDQGFVAGTSANLHGQPSIKRGIEAFHQFGINRKVDIILMDRVFEAERMFGGSHAMFSFSESNDELNPVRGGSITLGSYRSIYPQLVIPEDWQDPVDAVDMDVNKVRRAKSYLRSKLAKVA